MAPRTQRTASRRYGPRGRREGNLKPLLVLGASALAVAPLVGLKFWLNAQRVELIASTLCPIAGPTGVHAVLLDRSDPITPLQAQRLHQVLDKVVEDARVGQRIDLYVLAGDGTQALSPAVSLCRPKSDGNELYENPAHIRETYRMRFQKPLDEALSAMLLPATSKSSPIMESVKAVCVAAFGELPKGSAAHLTIASDMIQHSPLLDHYRNRDFDTFAQTPAYKEVLADCHQASMDVLYLVRPRDVRVQDRRHQLFWEKFLDHENAVLTSMEAI
jgi:hypothetical protein